MPYRRKYRGKKRRPRRRFNRRRRGMARTIVRGPSIVADVYTCKLRYAFQTDMSPLVPGNPTFQVMRGNSVYDPDLSGIGAQPNGLDEIMAFYTRYRVNASKIVCMTNTLGTSNASSTYALALHPYDASVSPTLSNVSDLAGNPYTRFVISGNVNVRPLRVKHYMATRKIFGRKTFDDNFSGTDSSNPTNQWLWALYVQALDRLTNITVYANIVITYYVSFYERKSLGIS